MGLLTDFFVATEPVAAEYKHMQIEDSDESEEYLSKLERVEHKGLTGLEISSLWAILENTSLSLKRHSLRTLPVEEEDESITEQFPDELKMRLSALAAHELEELAEKWSQVEEVRHSPEDLTTILADLNHLATSAASSGKQVFIWSAL